MNILALGIKTVSNTKEVYLEVFSNITTQAQLLLSIYAFNTKTKEEVIDFKLSTYRSHFSQVLTAQKDERLFASLNVIFDSDDKILKQSDIYEEDKTSLIHFHILNRHDLFHVLPILCRLKLGYQF